MTVSSLPSTMQAWQYSSTKGGLENNLKLNPAALPTPKPDQHVVQVIAVALNPVDCKPAEVIGSIPLARRFLIPNPATPGLDFAGRIITPSKTSNLKQGQLVFGVAGTSFLAGGALAQYALSSDTQCIPLPSSMDTIDAATVGTAGLTAIQSIQPHVKKGDRIFINGGSGGVGCFGIQIAKALGCYVATTCSTANVPLCNNLGADLVIDYKTQDIIDTLSKTGLKFDHVVDNVAVNDDLYYRCHEYTKPSAKYIYVGAVPGLAFVLRSLRRKVLPGFLGGGKRKAFGFFAEADVGDLTQIAEWMKGGEVKAVVDERFPFAKSPDAFRKLKTGRARGKIVVDVWSGEK